MNALRYRVQLIFSALPVALILITGCGTSTTTSSAPKSLSSISITPANPSIAVNATEQFTATGNYSDGSTANLSSSANWASTKQSIATVSEAGLGTGVAAGNTSITASMSGVTGATTLTVTAAAVTVTSIAVTPATASITTGATQQFTATATYSDGTTGNVTASATWASSNTTAATVNTAGLATGSSVGSSTISATLSGTSGSATLTVVAPMLTSITVSPSDPSFLNGATEQFTATANYSNNTTSNVTSSATWSSSNTAIATISSAGLATGQGGGTTTISAALSGITGGATASVTLSGTTSITTWHVDTNRSGLNSQEAILTPANVNASNFGKLFSCPVDGYVYGAPLILSHQSVNGALHNVLYVATENDSVYAYDADTCGGGTPLWKVSLLQSGETPLADEAILPHAGVTSTPVLSFVAANIFFTYSLIIGFASDHLTSGFAASCATAEATSASGRTEPNRTKYRRLILAIRIAPKSWRQPQVPARGTWSPPCCKLVRI